MPAVLQRGPNLPPPSAARSRVCWPLDGPCREVTLLSDSPRDPGKQCTRMVKLAALALARARFTLQIPPRGLCRYCVVAALTERRDARWLPRLARQLLRGCRDLR